jgi:phospholipase C
LGIPVGISNSQERALKKRSIDRLLSERGIEADLRELSIGAACGTNLIVDRVFASLTNSFTYRLPVEANSAENALRKKLMELSADVRSKLADEAVQRLTSAASQRTQFYGEFASVDIVGKTEPTATLLRKALPAKLKAVQERIRSRLSDKAVREFQPGFMSTPFHLIKERIDEQLKKVQPTVKPRKAQDHKPSEKRFKSEKTTLRDKRQIVLNAPTTGFNRKEDDLSLVPTITLKVPTEIELRLKKVTCNTATKKRGKDEIFLACRLTDYYNGDDVYTAPFKVGKLNEKNPTKAYDTPIVLGRIPVADNLVFDSIFDATVYLAESDLGPRDFEKYVEGTASITGHAFKQIVVATYVSTAIALMLEEESLDELIDENPVLLLVSDPLFLLVVALGLLPPKWQFIVNGLIGLLPAILVGTVYAISDGMRRLIKDEIFPENIVHFHLSGPIAVAADRDEVKFPAKIENFELRKQQVHRSTVVFLKDKFLASSTADMAAANDPDLIASYTVELEWVIRTSDESIPVNDLVPAQPLTDETEALQRLEEQIDHIIVIMMENRSFDHMLGFLEHDRGRKDLDPTVSAEFPNGLPRVNTIAGVDFEPFALDESRFPIDPAHSVFQVGRQIWGRKFWDDGVPEENIPAWKTEHAQQTSPATDDEIEFPEEAPAESMSGFAASFRQVVDGTRASLVPDVPGVNLEDPENNPHFDRDVNDVKQIMGYHPAENVPYFDFLATEFGVCSKWFCAFPGNTWVNRTLAYTGKPAKFRANSAEQDSRLVVDNDMPLDEASFVRILEEKGRNWAWYAQDFPSVLSVDLSLADHIQTERIRRIERFFEDLENPSTFPEVAWIDPNFMDFGDFGTIASAALRRAREIFFRLGKSDSIGEEQVELNTANSDQPPADVMHGQAFLQMVIEKLMDSPVWNRSLVIITYDEHGGFYDHVPVPRIDPALQPDIGPLNPFNWYGPRVPALVVSPHIGRQLVFSQAPPDVNGVQKVVNHLSIQRTILQRFCRNGESIDAPVDYPSPRVEASEHLGWVLSGPNLRFPPAQAASIVALRRRNFFNRAIKSVLKANTQADRLKVQRRGKQPQTDFQRVYLKKQLHIAQRVLAERVKR